MSAASNLLVQALKVCSRLFHCVGERLISLLGQLQAFLPNGKLDAYLVDLFFEPLGLNIQPSDFAGIYRAPQPPSGQKPQAQKHQAQKHQSGYWVIVENRRCRGSQSLEGP
jgi:hypothetical protein